MGADLSSKRKLIDFRTLACVADGANVCRLDEQVFGVVLGVDEIQHAPGWNTLTLGGEAP
jgi:hypothetical protein